MQPAAPPLKELEPQAPVPAAAPQKDPSDFLVLVPKDLLPTLESKLDSVRF